MKLGLTGTICSGKTLVADILKEEFNVRIVDTDIIAREVTKKDTGGWHKIKEIWGTSVLDESGELNRKKLGDKIFSSKKDRETLNKITHPLIMKRVIDSIVKIRKEEDVVVVVPLLFEIVVRNIFDKVWLVACSEDKIIERLIKRDNISYEEVQLRLKSQMSQEEKKKLADIVIYNDGTPETTRKNVIMLWKEWKGLI